MLNKGIGENSLTRVFELIEEKVNFLKGLIEGKANSSHSHSSSEVTGLSAVATSGNYNDLSNKPTIPAAYTHPASHPASMITGLATVATSGKYSDLSNIPVISNKAYSNGQTWYFPLGSMVIDNSGNYGNFTFTGRLGGWTNANAATFSIMLMNRANYNGDVITATVSASGEVANALAITDIVVAKNSDLSHTVYLKCNGYFCFDFAYTQYQHSIIYNGSYSTTAPSDIIWTLSGAPKTILAADGSFTATGGIDATTLAGYGLRIVEDENDPGRTGYITVIK